MLTNYTVTASSGSTTAQLAVDIIARVAELTITYGTKVTSEARINGIDLLSVAQGECYLQDPMPIVDQYGTNKGFEPRIAHFDRLNRLYENDSAFLAVAA